MMVLVVNGTLNQASLRPIRLMKGGSIEGGNWGAHERDRGPALRESQAHFLEVLDWEVASELMSTLARA